MPRLCNITQYWVPGRDAVVIFVVRCVCLCVCMRERERERERETLLDTMSRVIWRPIFTPTRLQNRLVACLYFLDSPCCITHENRRPDIISFSPIAATGH